MRLRHFFFSALIVGICLVFSSTRSPAGIFISVGIAPPPLPIYVQPELPGPGYIWTPGYWAWDPNFNDYYWVPGTWVFAPRPGFLWTPPWWGWSDGYYAFHDGYWGPHIGFYGGVVYGFGYNGAGYEGGRWDHGQFYYNRSVNNVTNVHVTNVYSQTVVENRNTVSYNGGAGGIAAQPTAEQLQAEHESHLAPTALQAKHVRAASANTALRYSANQGHPTVAATAKPGVFNKGITSAKAVHTSSAGTVNSPETRTTGEGAGTAGTEYHPETVKKSSSGTGSGAPKPSAKTDHPHAKPAQHASKPSGGNKGKDKDH